MVRSVIEVIIIPTGFKCGDKCIKLLLCLHASKQRVECCLSLLVYCMRANCLSRFRWCWTQVMGLIKRIRYGDAW